MCSLNCAFLFTNVGSLHEAVSLSRMGVAAGEEGGMLVVIDHWEVDHRAHKTGADHRPKIHDATIQTFLGFDHMLHAEEDAGQWDVPLYTKHSPMSVAADEEGAMLAVIDHWEDWAQAARRRGCWPMGCFPARYTWPHERGHR